MYTVYMTDTIYSIPDCSHRPLSLHPHKVHITYLYIHPPIYVICKPRSGTINVNYTHRITFLVESKMAAQQPYWMLTHLEHSLENTTLCSFKPCTKRAHSSGNMCGLVFSVVNISAAIQVHYPGTDSRDEGYDIFNVLFLLFNFKSD